MTEQLLGLGSKIMLVLEGGYNKDVLSWAGQNIARSLLGQLK
jgi:acetoin utilization deacetylase AcuC-like enzyme